jgi:hypothetical protein
MDDGRELDCAILLTLITYPPAKCLLGCRLVLADGVAPDMPHIKPAASYNSTLRLSAANLSTMPFSIRA